MVKKLIEDLTSVKFEGFDRSTQTKILEFLSNKFPTTRPCLHEEETWILLKDLQGRELGILRFDQSNDAAVYTTNEPEFNQFKLDNATGLEKLSNDFKSFTSSIEFMLCALGISFFIVGLLLNSAMR